MMREQPQEAPIETPPPPTDPPAWVVEEEEEAPPLININTDARGTTFTSSNSIWTLDTLNRFFAGTPSEPTADLPF